jgi:hypothetical protein
LSHLDTGPWDADTRPEVALLLAAARVHLLSHHAERIRNLVRSPLDWPYLLRIADRHGLMALLCWHINALCCDAVPADALASLRQHFTSNLQHNLLLTGELRTLLKQFDASHIRAMPFKGPALTMALYGNLALREFCDLDVLIHRDDVPCAKRLLESRGYRSHFPVSGSQIASFVRHHTDLSFQDDLRAILLEIHWEFLPKLMGFRLAPTQLWGRLDTVRLGGEAFRTLPPVESLLLAAAHGCKHGWQRLGWVCDIAEWVRVHREADWAKILGEAGRLGCERMLLLSLCLANDLLDTCLPDEVSDALRRDGVAVTLAKQVREVLFLPEEPDTSLVGRWLFHLRARERLRDRVGYLTRLVLAPTVFDWEAAPLPPSLYFLSYLIRPVRLAGKYGRLLARRSPASER